MKKCSVCGAVVTDEETKCPKCGADIGADAQQNAQAPGGGYSYGSYSNASSAGTGSPVSGLDRTAEYDPADIQETKIINIISYFSILFFLPLVVYPNSKVGRFHANQALVLLIFSAVLSTFTSIMAAFSAFSWIGFMFGIIATSIGSVTGLVFLAAFIFELVNIIDNKVVELPLIGKIKIIK